VVLKSAADAGEALARELFEWCHERLAYFKAPAWVRFVPQLPTTSTQKIRKIEIFPSGADPRSGAFDLRQIKAQRRDRGGAGRQDGGPLQS
jgi:hypothetical protein